jgi:hypothetical protein
MTDQPAESQNPPQPTQPAGQPAQPAGEQPPPDPSPFARPNIDLVDKGADPSKWERR